MTSAKRMAVWIAAGFVLAAIAWLRLDGFTRGTIWAEDGRDFLAGALHGDSVFRPYEGYTHVVPRILADLTVAVAPVPRYAVAMTALTIVVAAGIGLLVFGLTAELGISRGARIALALLTVAAPALITEVSGNAANLHWLFLWLAPWLMLARPATWLRSALLAGVTFLAITTEIQMLLFLPLLLVDVRNRRRWPLAAAALLGAAVQGVALLTSDREGQTEHPGVLSTLHGYALEVGGGGWLTPISPLTAQVADHGWWVAYALLVPFAAAAVWLFATCPQLRVVVAALALGSVVSWAAGFTMNLGAAGHFAGATPEQIRTIGSLRHAVVPSMFLLAIAVLAADRLLARAGDASLTRVRRGAGLVLAAALIVSTVLSLDGHGDSHRSAGPAWRAAVTEARLTCERTQVESISIKTAPPDPRWTLPVSCRRLLAGGE